MSEPPGGAPGGRAERPPYGPVLSAALLALAFAGVWPVVFVALIPWLASLRGATPRQAWNRGYAFGLLFSLSQLWWLGDLAYKWTGSAFLGIVPWLLASLLSAVYYGLLGRLVRSCGLLGAWWAIPLVWAGMEVFRSYIPVFAFPWALVAEPLVVTPLRGLAWFGTIYLVSALVVAANVALAERRWVALGAGAALAGLLVAAWALAFRPPLVRSATLALRTYAAGQLGVDQSVPDGSAEQENGPAADALIAEAYRRHALLVLPEGVVQGLTALPPRSLPFRVPKDMTLVFGAQRGRGPVYQSAIGYSRGEWSAADKTRLVIFGEFVPGRDILPFLGAFHLPSGDLSAGDKLAQLRMGGTRVGPLICFEALFPDLGLRQAWLKPNFIAVMSVDDWFQGSPAPTWLARAARWRATETGTVVVRAGSLGKTMIVGRQGEVLKEAPYGGRRLVVATVFDDNRGPFPLVWLFPFVAAGALVAVPALARRRQAVAE